MTRRITLISLVGIAVFAVPLSSRADSGDVLSTQEGPGIEDAVADSQSKKSQSLKPNGRLKGTVEYKMEHGNGKGDFEGQAENVQSADPPENWEETGRNSRGVIRYGKPGRPVISGGQINLKLIEGSKLPPTDIGNPTFTYYNDDIYGSEGEPPPYSEFTGINSKPSGLRFGHGSMENIDPWTDIKLKESKPAKVKLNATTGDADANKPSSSWIESNTSEPAK